METLFWSNDYYIYPIYLIYCLHLIIEFIIVSYRYRQCMNGTQIQRPSLIRRLSQNHAILSRTASAINLMQHIHHNSDNNHNQHQHQHQHQPRLAVSNSHIDVNPIRHSNMNSMNKDDINTTTTNNNNDINNNNRFLLNQRRRKSAFVKNIASNCVDSKILRIFNQYICIIIIYVLLFSLLTFVTIWIGLVLVCVAHLLVIFYYNIQFVSLLEWFMNQFAQKSRHSLYGYNETSNTISRDLAIIRKVARYTKIMCIISIIGFIFLIVFDCNLWIMPLFIFFSNVFESKCFVYNNHWLLSPIDYCKYKTQHPCLAMIMLLFWKNRDGIFFV